VKITRSSPKTFQILFNNVGDTARTNGTTTFADSEADRFLHGDGSEQLNLDGNIVTGQNQNSSGETAQRLLAMLAARNWPDELRERKRPTW
jgi:putative intracellular protease/amidase